MTFIVVKDKQGFFRVKNTITGKVGKDRFMKKNNAEIQRKNRERFIRLIQKKAGNPSKKGKDKNKK